MTSHVPTLLGFIGVVLLSLGGADTALPYVLWTAVVCAAQVLQAVILCSTPPPDHNRP